MVKTSMMIEEEIERLRAKKVELAAKMSLTHDFEEKEEIKERIDELDRQIEMLEKLASNR